MSTLPTACPDSDKDTDAPPRETERGRHRDGVKKAREEWRGQRVVRDRVGESMREGRKRKAKRGASGRVTDALKVGRGERGQRDSE